ncbi:MAG: OsmC family protein [Pseudomonadales bacterium]
MEARIDWRGKVQFEALSGSGHSVMLDGPEDVGGVNAGARPMELILMGLGGCASYDVVTILQKSRQQVSDCQTRVTAERADAVPAVFSHIHLEFIVSGENLKESQVKRAVELSAEKYCSASIMLGKGGVDITHSYKIT